MTDKNMNQEQKKEYLGNPIVAILYCGVSIIITTIALTNVKNFLLWLVLFIITGFNCVFSILNVYGVFSNMALKAFKDKLKTMSTESLEEELNNYYREAAIGVTKKMSAIGNRKKLDKADSEYNKTLVYGGAVLQELRNRGKNYMGIHEAALKGYVIAGSPMPQTPKKDASVIKSAVVGGVVAGPAGAVVGAVHAADKNNRATNKSTNKE